MAHPIPPPADGLSARHVVELFDRLASGDGIPGESGPLMLAIRGLHETNARIWAEEDLARRRSVGDAEIVANKRAIDSLNQRRNDLVEQADEILFEALQPAMGGAVRLHSETPGQMIDRLSILTLKIRAMRLQAERTDADEAHRAACG